MHRLEKNIAPALKGVFFSSLKRTVYLRRNFLLPRAFEVLRFAQDDRAVDAPALKGGSGILHAKCKEISLHRLEKNIAPALKGVFFSSLKRTVYLTRNFLLPRH